MNIIFQRWLKLLFERQPLEGGTDFLVGKDVEVFISCDHDCRDYPDLCGSKGDWPGGHRKVPLNVRELLQGKYQSAACRYSYIPVLQPSE